MLKQLLEHDWNNINLESFVNKILKKISQISSCNLEI